MSAVVATIEDVAALQARIDALEQRIAELSQRAGGGDDELLTPIAVARRYKLRDLVVYAAIKSGALVAEERSARGRTTHWIRPVDARRWYEREAAKRSNQ